MNDARRTAERPRTPFDVWLYVCRRFGIRLPWKSFSAGHSTPSAFVAEAFLDPGRDVAAWANRSGLKTLSASILAALEFRFSDSPLSGRVLAGSEEQARTLYEYWTRWCWEVLADRLDGNPGRLLTRLNNGDFEILSASQKRVRGAKVQRLFRDEVDEIDPALMGASVGMLASRPAAPARTVDTSTWHRADGPMGQLVADAADRGVRLHKWNVWEAIERCPPERHEHGRGCRHCRLAAACVEKARQFHGDPDCRVGIASECCGLLAIDDVTRQFTRWSRQQWQAEAECRRPSLEGLVYPAFDRHIHVRADLSPDANLPTWRAIDWGWSNFVCLWIQADKSGCVRVVDEYWAANTTTADNARKIGQRDDGLHVDATFCDPAGHSRNDQTGYSDTEVFQGFGIPCMYTTAPWAREVRNGINLIRSFLEPVAGPARLIISGRCEQLIRSFESYRSRRVNSQYIDEPAKPQACDHPMDALRYYFVNQWAPTRTEARRMSYV